MGWLHSHPGRLLLYFEQTASLQAGLYLPEPALFWHVYCTFLIKKS